MGELTCIGVAAIFVEGTSNNPDSVPTTMKNPAVLLEADELVLLELLTDDEDEVDELLEEALDTLLDEGEAADEELLEEIDVLELLLDDAADADDVLVEEDKEDTDCPTLLIEDELPDEPPPLLQADKSIAENSPRQ